MGVFGIIFIVSGTYFTYDEQNLYNAKVRKVVVMGLAPMGCAPYYLWLYENTDGKCVEMINDMILEFNFEMRQKIEELSVELADARIIFCDAYEASMDIMKHHRRYGEKLKFLTNKQVEDQWRRF